MKKSNLYRVQVFAFNLNVVGYKEIYKQVLYQKQYIFNLNVVGYKDD